MGEVLILDCHQMALFVEAFEIADWGSGRFLLSTSTVFVGWVHQTLRSGSKEETVEVVFAGLKVYRELRRGCWL